MSTSRLVFTPAGKQEMAVNGISAACHVRILNGTFEPSLALATVSDLANESTHADYSPVDIAISTALNGPLLEIGSSNPSFNDGNPTTLGGKYLAICKGTVAAATGATPVLYWCDGAVDQLTAVSISNTNPAVVTFAAHGKVAGDVFCISDCESGDLIGGFFTIANEAANTFELVGLDLTGNAGPITADLIDIGNTDEDSAAADIAHAAFNGIYAF